MHKLIQVDVHAVKLFSENPTSCKVGYSVTVNYQMDKNAAESTSSMFAVLQIALA